MHYRYYPSDNRWELDCLDALTTLCAECHEVVTAMLRQRRCDKVIIETTSVVRTTPANEVPIERLPDSDLQSHRRCAPAYAQWAASGPLNRHSQSIAQITKKKKKTDADHRELSRREFFGSLYLDVGGKRLGAQQFTAGRLQKPFLALAQSLLF